MAVKRDGAHILTWEGRGRVAASRAEEPGGAARSHGKVEIGRKGSWD
jgi:hypothetical protein